MGADNLVWFIDEATDGLAAAPGELGDEPAQHRGQLEITRDLLLSPRNR